uniref:hepcidin-like n=1 Tax=Maylandia zebra TaxID=106582 RepID=UPI000329EA6F|nr:hepcidin-like [Maylandia zebra]
MKTFASAVILAVALTIYIEGNAAFPFTTVEDMEEEKSTDDPAAMQEETSVETWMMPFDIGENHNTSPVRCHHCCDCCLFSGCGICCQ